MAAAVVVLTTAVMLFSLPAPVPYLRVALTGGLLLFLVVPLSLLSVTGPRQKLRTVTRRLRKLAGEGPHVMAKAGASHDQTPHEIRELEHAFASLAEQMQGAMVPRALLTAREQALAIRDEQLKVTDHLSRVMISGRSIEATLAEISSIVRGATDFSMVGVLIKEGAGLRLAAQVGLDGLDAAGCKAFARQSLLTKSILARQAVIIGGLQEDPEHADALLRELGADTVACYPLLGKDGALGALVMADPRPRCFDDDALGWWGTLAHHIAALADRLLTYQCLVQSNEALSVARASAEGTSHAKSEFLANMSHEIRTPLTAILGYADLLRDQDLGEKGRGRCIETIRRNGEYLLAVINDILDISKIEAGKMSVEHINCSPCRLVMDVVDLMKVRAEAKSVALETDFRWPLPASIESDPIRLRQILVNLVGNAIKFTEEGGVRLIVSLREVDDGTLLVFEVRDTGIGMSPNMIESLFQPFTQAETSHARRFGGTGLGLAISRRLAELLGGDLSASSKAGFGSTFELATRILISENTDMVRDLRSVAGGGHLDSLVTFEEGPVQRCLQGRVLLVEDGRENRRLISFMLTKAGLEVDEATDGREALARVEERSAAGERYDVILMDMAMPVMDGYEATEKLRSDGYEGPIVALTAYAMAGDRERCLAAGCDDYVPKPIKRGKLLGLVESYLAGEKPTADALSALPPLKS